MKRLQLVLAVIGATAIGVSTSHAVTMTLGGVAASDGSGLTTKHSWATVYDFEAGSKPLDLNPASYGGFTDAGGVVSGSTSHYAKPAGDSTYYLTVAYGAASGSQDITLAERQNYFGLYWGSIDDYNTIKFLYNNAVVKTFTGAQVSTTAAGSWTAASDNEYVNFYFGPGEWFDGVILETERYAFESDNHAFGTSPVPEPGTMLLLGSGLLGLAGYGRRRRAS